MALSSEEVQAFMDYLEDAIPVKGKINKDGKEVTDTSIRDADVYHIEQEAENLYEILQKVAQMANLYFKYEISHLSNFL